MNKYKVEFNLTAQKKGKPKYDVIFGQTEDSALADSSITRDQIVGIYLLVTAETPVAPDGTPAYVPVDYPVTEQLTPTEQPPVLPSVQDEPFQGGGGEFGGAGASGSFDSPTDNTPSPSFESSSSSDSGSSSFDSSGGGSDLN